MTALPYDKISEDFQAFHAKNPVVYALFDRFTKDLIRAGYQNSSAKLIFERIRWETMFRPVASSPVKLNNNYTSRYARLWELNNPQHKGFFRRRSISPASINSVRVPPHERRDGL